VASLKAGSAVITTPASSSSNGLITLDYTSPNLVLGEMDTITMCLVASPITVPAPDGTTTWTSHFKYPTGGYSLTLPLETGDQIMTVVGPSSAANKIITGFNSPYDHKVGTGVPGQALRYTLANSAGSPEKLASARVVIPGGAAGFYFSSVSVTGVSSDVTVTALVNATPPLPATWTLFSRTD